MEEVYSILRSRFRAIKYRCSDPKNNRYYLYGARGIRCEWNDFYEFSRDMRESFIEHVKAHGIGNTQIDRIDVDGNYRKDNCRWATMSEQSRNRRDRKAYKCHGKELSLMDWSKELQVPISTLHQRIYLRKWPLEKALSSERRINQFI